MKKVNNTFLAPHTWGLPPPHTWGPPPLVIWGPPPLVTWGLPPPDTWGPPPLHTWGPPPRSHWACRPCTHVAHRPWSNGDCLLRTHGACPPPCTHGPHHHPLAQMGPTTPGHMGARAVLSPPIK